MFRGKLKFLFTKRNLLITNSLTSGLFMAIGDTIQQEYEFRHNLIPKRYDWARIKRMTIVGFIMGTGHHFYYFYLDKHWPKADVKTVLKKIATDQLLCSPLTLLFFYYSMGYLENKSIQQSNQEIRKKLLYTYMGDTLFWPPIQAINFYFLPREYRVFYINVCHIFYNIFLSLMKHFDQIDDENDGTRR